MSDEFLRPVSIDADDDGTRYGAAGGQDAAGLITAIAGAVETAVGVGVTGVETEYSPQVRVKHLQEWLPSLLSSLKKQLGTYDAIAMGPVQRKLKKLGKPPLKLPPEIVEKLKWLKTDRPVHSFFFVPIVITTPQLDDTMNIQLWADGVAAHGSSSTLPGGGNIDGTRLLLKGLLSEVLVYSSMPLALVSAIGYDGINASAISAMESIFTAPKALELIYGPSRETRAKRLPWAMRERILRSYIEWRNTGLMQDSQPLPRWLFGFAVDGSGEQPAFAPTIGSYRALSQAVGSGKLNATNIQTLRG